MEAISRKKEVVEVIEIKKAIRGFYKTVQPGPPIGFLDQFPDYDTGYRAAINPAAPTLLVLEDEIDISGLTTHMEKALMISHVDVHQSPNYAAGFTITPTPIGAPSSASFITEVIMITDTPWNFNSWRSGLNAGLIDIRLPGVFSDSLPARTEVLSTDNIIFGRMRTITNDIFAPSSVTRITGESFFGDGKITMSDRLYVYRFSKWNGAFDLGVPWAIPDIELVINGHKGELGELEQVMELRRSYLLQQDI